MIQQLLLLPPVPTSLALAAEAVAASIVEGGDEAAVQVLAQPVAATAPAPNGLHALILEPTHVRLRPEQRLYGRYSRRCWRGWAPGRARFEDCCFAVRAPPGCFDDPTYADGITGQTCSAFTGANCRSAFGGTEQARIVAAGGAAYAVLDEVVGAALGDARGHEGRRDAVDNAGGAPLVGGDVEGRGAGALSPSEPPPPRRALSL